MLPLLTTPLAEVHPVPKFIEMFFGKPWAGVTVTTAQEGKFPMGDSIPAGVEPEQKFYPAAWFNIFSASEFRFSEIALSVATSVVEAISVPDDDELLLLSFLQEARPAVNEITAEAIIKCFSFIKFF